MGDRKFLKTFEEAEADRKLYYELPRKTCEQIAPSMLRLKYKAKMEQKRVMNIMRRIIKRSQYEKVAKKIGHIIDFDKSESIIPHGEVSKRLYNDIWESRSFDLYGGQVKKKEFDVNQIRGLKEWAKELDIKYTHKQEKIEGSVDIPDIFENITDKLEAPILMTAKHKIGFADIYNAPVGLAKNPKVMPVRSEGNEVFFAYDGQWTKGKMHGYGKYLYDDGFTCNGQFENNWQNGYAVSEYPNADKYEGHWKNGKFHGSGKLSTAGGSYYEGDFVAGLRHGRGKIVHPSGLVYEGHWAFGLPQGHGKVESASSKYSYEGDFEKGSIKGTGTLITPKGERIMRIWSEKDAPPGTVITLPVAVRIILEDAEKLKADVRSDGERLYGTLRGMQMQDYVMEVRASIHNERTAEKKRKYEEAKQAALEHQAKLREARLRALAGDPDSDEDETPEVIQLPA
jgi:hypothetical protein